MQDFSKTLWVETVEGIVINCFWKKKVTCNKYMSLGHLTSDHLNAVLLTSAQ